MFAQVKLADKLGIPLPEGSAYDSFGNPTTNPLEVFHGAMTVWGGAKGSGLAMMVQLLGIAAGSSEPTPFMSDFGFLVLAFDPSVLSSMDRVKAETDKFCESIRSAKRIDEAKPVRMPFDRSVESRNAARAKNYFLVEDEVLRQLEEASKKD
jgi:delta1-piperideine-2-carboxylate reductase